MNEHVRHHEHRHTAEPTVERIDPVCGMRVGGDTPHRYSFGGREFRFCSERCRDRFAAEPDKYIRAHTNALASAGHTSANESTHTAHVHGAPASPATPRASPPDIDGAAETIYTCPMHPEIRRSAPGNCPICGMALEPVMPSLDEQKNPELVDFEHRFWWALPLSIVGVMLAWAGTGLCHSLPRRYPGSSWPWRRRSSSGRDARFSSDACNRFAIAARTCGR